MIGPLVAMYFYTSLPNMVLLNFCIFNTYMYIVFLYWDLNSEALKHKTCICTLVDLFYYLGYF